MNRPVNIRYVARLAGVSATTVSRVLNNSPIPSPATRQCVMNAVESSNYQPDPLLSQAFRRQRLGERNQRVQTKVIGYLTTGFLYARAQKDDGYYSRILAGIQKAVQENGYHLMPEDLPVNQVTLPDMVREQRIDGLIMEGNFPEVLLKTIVQRIPVVFLDHTYPELPAGSVMPHIERAVQEELEYLWEKGHRDIIAFIPDVSSAHINAYQRAFHYFFTRKGHAIPQADLCRPRTINPETHDQVMTEYACEVRGRKIRPTALIAYDIYAASLVAELQKSGMQLPKEMSVMGMDDIAMARTSKPELTSYRFPLHDMGRLATEMLIQRLKEPSLPIQHLLVNGQVVERASIIYLQ